MVWEQKLLLTIGLAVAMLVIWGVGHNGLPELYTSLPMPPPP